MQFSQEEPDHKISISKFEKMLKTNSLLFFDSEEFESIIHFYLNNGKVALAKKAIKLGLDQHPSSVNLKLFQVEVYIFEDNLSKANKILDELHLLEPTNDEIYIQKANLLSKQDKHQDAITFLKKALELSEDASDIYSLIGMENLFLDQFDEAKHNFMKCLELDEFDYAALYNVIYCFEFLEQPEEAITFLNSFLNTNPYCEVAWHQLGKLYYDAKDYPKALTAFDFAIISDDTFIGAYIEKGKTLEKLSKYNEAIENYAITLELEDPTSYALLQIAKCYDKTGNNKLALEYYYKTVHEDPMLDKGWIAITKFYSKHKNYQKALYYINKAINIDTENIVYWKIYANINLRLNHYEEAESGYKKAIDLGDYALETWLTRADILIQLGETETAMYNLLQGMEFHPENAEIEFRLAGIYFQLNETEKAAYHLKNGMTFDKEYLFVIQELFPNILESPLYLNALKKFGL